jgi:hypothetical protein
MRWRIFRTVQLAVPVAMVEAVELVLAAAASRSSRSRLLGDAGRLEQSFQARAGIVRHGASHRSKGILRARM